MIAKKTRFLHLHIWVIDHVKEISIIGTIGLVASILGILGIHLFDVTLFQSSSNVPMPVSGSPMADQDWISPYTWNNPENYTGKADKINALLPLANNGLAILSNNVLGKIESDGSVDWWYGIDPDPPIISATVAQNGTVIGVGSQWIDSGGNAGFVVAFDSNGSLLWDNGIGPGNSSLSDTGFSGVTVTSDNEIVAVGATCPPNTSDDDGSTCAAIIAEYSLSGEPGPVWISGTTRYAGFEQVAATSDGNIIATGCGYEDPIARQPMPTYNPEGTMQSSRNCTPLVAKFTPSGEHIFWTNYLPESNEFIINSISAGSSNSTIFAEVDNTSGSNGESLVECLSDKGQLQWEVQLGNKVLVSVNDVAVTSNGDVIVVGATESTNLASPILPTDPTLGKQALIIRISPAGKVLSSYSYGGDNADELNAVAVTGTDSVVVAGWSLSSDFPSGYLYTSGDHVEHGFYIRKTTWQ